MRQRHVDWLPLRNAGEVRALRHQILVRSIQIHLFKVRFQNATNKLVLLLRGLIQLRFFFFSLSHRSPYLRLLRWGQSGHRHLVRHPPLQASPGSDRPRGARTPALGHRCEGLVKRVRTIGGGTGDALLRPAVAGGGATGHVGQRRENPSGELRRPVFEFQLVSLHGQHFPLVLSEIPKERKHGASPLEGPHRLRGRPGAAPRASEFEDVDEHIDRFPAAKVVPLARRTVSLACGWRWRGV
mmetsp:Transcript_19268/g.40447  ORF Transcript_19268/g.40447 Transcript_19268/m.40447 type:complete len:241 (-) Transcript_19268:450-1172(-)